MTTTRPGVKPKEAVIQQKQMTASMFSRDTTSFYELVLQPFFRMVSWEFVDRSFAAQTNDPRNHPKEHEQDAGMRKPTGL